MSGIGTPKAYQFAKTSINLAFIYKADKQGMYANLIECHVIERKDYLAYSLKPSTEGNGNSNQNILFIYLCATEKPTK